MFTLTDAGNATGALVAEAETLAAARVAARTLILEDEEYDTLYIHAPDGEWLETATRLEGAYRDEIQWTNTDLVRRYDGRSRR